MDIKLIGLLSVGFVVCIIFMGCSTGTQYIKGSNGAIEVNRFCFYGMCKHTASFVEVKRGR